MVVTLLLDTNVVIYLLGGRLKQSLPVGPVGVSIITEMELLSFPDLAPDDERIVH
jgi:predicted nucleic acid-binding protein